MKSYIQSIIAMLAVINPFICGVMVLQDKDNQDRKGNIIDGLKAMTVVLIILLVAAIGGRYILKAFGISLDAFKIVGGIILGFIGSQMMIGSSGGNFTDEDQGSLNRLIMFAASPASIAMVVTLGTVHNSEGLPLNAIIGTVTAVIVTIITIIIMQLLLAKKNISKANIGSRFMGMIIAAMGLQFMLEGIKAFFF